MNVMILAAGLGTRLRPYTNTLPKPAIPFMTVPLVLYGLELLDRLKIHHLVLNTHHLPDQIQKLAPLLKSNCEQLIFSHESPDILGSGGGIRHALPDLLGRGDFIVFNGDEVFLPNQLGVFDEMLKFHQFHQGIATLMCIQHPEVGSKFGGAYVDKNGRVRDFSKTPLTGFEGLHFVGFMILSDRIKDFFIRNSGEENILYDTLKNAIGKGEEVFTFKAEGKWFETGNPGDFLTATRACLNCLQSNSTDFWCEHLRQVICRNSTEACVIENDHPELKQRVLSYVSALRMV